MLRLTGFAPAAAAGVLAVAVLAATYDSAPVPAPVHRAAGSDTLPAWLAGHWEGTGFGGVVEETWTPPRDGVMLGTFRLSIGGRSRLFEFMILSIEQHPTMRLKHFNADGSPWEDQDTWVTFPYERSTDHGIDFDGLTYELVAADELRVAVHVGREDGSSEIVELRLRRRR